MSNAPYVFISYAHKDAAIVLPCIDQLTQSGVNIWYDEGIQAGSEWPEYIAEKVVSCTKFVLFISNAYLDSQNCKRELNFAISRKKDILSVFIEDVNLSPGMEMQLGTYQSVFRNRFANETIFTQSLCSEAWFNSCRIGGAPYTEAQPTQSYSAPSHSYSESYQANPAPSFDVSTHALPVKNRMIAILLAVFLGFFGAHKFYLGQKTRGIVYLLFCWTYIPMILSILEAIFIFLSSDEKFCQKYNCRTQ